METLIKMLNVFAWIATIGFPLVIIIKIHMQSKYENSLEQNIDNLNGVQATYMRHIGKLFVLFVIALIYLIVK